MTHFQHLNRGWRPLFATGVSAGRLSLKSSNGWGIYSCPSDAIKGGFAKPASYCYEAQLLEARVPGAYPGIRDSNADMRKVDGHAKWYKDPPHTNPDGSLKSQNQVIAEYERMGIFTDPGTE